MMIITELKGEPLDNYFIMSLVLSSRSSAQLERLISAFPNLEENQRCSRLHLGDNGREPLITVKF